MAAMIHVSELWMNAEFAMEPGEHLHEIAITYVIILLLMNTVIEPRFMSGMEAIAIAKGWTFINNGNTNELGLSSIKLMRRCSNLLSCTLLRQSQWGS